MSFAPTIIRLAPKPLVNTKNLNRLVPRTLIKKVKAAEAREERWEKAKAEAIALGRPVPLFNPPKPVKGLKWYRVTRSHHGELPVYTDVKGNGGVTTIVRRIEVGLGGPRPGGAGGLCFTLPRGSELMTG